MHLRCLSWKSQTFFETVVFTIYISDHKLSPLYKQLDVCIMKYWIIRKSCQLRLLYILGFGSQFLLALTKRVANATGTRNIFLSNGLSSSADTPYPGSPGLKKAFSYHFSSLHPPARGITSQIYYTSCRLSWQFWLTWLFLTILTGNAVTVVRTYNKETFIMGNITFDIQGKL